MHEAAVAPDGPWVAQLLEHLGVEPGGLPVTTKTFRMADRPNLQLGLDAVLPDCELVGLPPHVTDGGEGITGLLRGIGNRRHGAPVQYVDVEVGDGRVMQCVAGATVAAAAHVPGGQPLLVAMIIFNAISTIVTTRNPTGDYSKALRALRS